SLCQSAPTRAADDPPWASASLHTILEHLHAVDEHVLHTLGVLVRLGIGRLVSNGRGVEDHHVGKEACCAPATSITLQVLRRQRRQTTYRLFERDQPARHE